MSDPSRLRLVAAVAASAVTALALPLPAAHAAPAEPTLRSEAPRDVKIGSAVWGQNELLGYDATNPTEFQRILAAEFNSVTPENDMKWAEVHPEPDVYDFSGADAVVAFAKPNGQQVRGHTLLWHSQNPQWVIDASASWTCAEARDVLESHVRTVVGRYAGEIYEWDVANEIFQDEWDIGGVQLRTEANPFLKACAEDPVALIGDVFRWANETDPAARLFLNDYNAEGINAKTDAYYALAQELLADGVPLEGFGAQGHLSLMFGFDDSMQANFERFADLGLSVAVTEADVRIPLGEDGEPDDAQIALQAERYDKMLEACLYVPACTSYTVWGFDDARSWVPGVFPGEGYATIMTEDFEKKPAYYALLETLMNFEARLASRLSWRNETTGSTHGYGVAAVRVSGEEVCFAIRWQNLPTPTAAHIHSGAAGVDGPVVVPLFETGPGPNAAAHSAWGCVTAERNVAQAIAAEPSEHYVNVHTEEFPSGAIRGQLAEI